MSRNDIPDDDDDFGDSQDNPRGAVYVWCEGDEGVGHPANDSLLP